MFGTILKPLILCAGMVCGLLAVHAGTRPPSGPEVRFCIPNTYCIFAAYLKDEGRADHIRPPCPMHAVARVLFGRRGIAGHAVSSGSGGWGSKNQTQNRQNKKIYVAFASHCGVLGVPLFLSVHVPWSRK